MSNVDTTLPSANQPSDVLMEPPHDIMNDDLIKPISSQTDNKPAIEVVSEPLDEFVDLTNNVTEAAADSVTTESTAAKGITEISLDESSDDFFDILGSETKATQGEVVVTDVTVAAAPDKSEVASNVAGPPGAGKQEVKESASVANINANSSASKTQELPGTNKFTDPLVDVLIDAPPAADAKINSKPPVDLFDDEGSDLFADPHQIKPAKQPQKSLFGEPDEDPFREPLGVAAKKTTGKEPKDKSVTSKAPAGDGVSIAGTLQVSNAEPADIFTEEATTTTLSIPNTSTANAKTNGVHSEEEADIFSGTSTDFRIWWFKRNFSDRRGV